MHPHTKRNMEARKMTEVLAIHVCVCVCMYGLCACVYTCVYGCALVCVCRDSKCSFEVIVTHKAAGIVVAHSLGIAESFKQWV